MQILLVSNPSWLLLTTTILFKMLASAISLGSGFRGGLFFASLLLGALTGQLYSTVLIGPFPNLALQPGTAAIAALAAFGTGVLGAPFSMVCLALEITGDFSVTVGAVVASSVCALLVRELFGYSFATWRFHLRGEVIRGPQDVGWVQQLSANSLMRGDFENALTTHDDRRRSENILASSGAADRLARSKRHLCRNRVIRRPAFDRDQGRTCAEPRHAGAAGDEFLLPHMSIRDIMTAFERSEADVLAVLDRADHRAAIGTVSEFPRPENLRRRAGTAQSGTVLQMNAFRAAGPCRCGRNRRDR